MPFSIQPFIVFTLLFRLVVRRNNGFCIAFNDQINKILGRIPAVSNHMVKSEPGVQISSLQDIMTLTSRKHQPQWIVQPVYRNVNLGTEAATTTPQCLLCLTATSTFPE